MRFLSASLVCLIVGLGACKQRAFNDSVTNGAGGNLVGYPAAAAALANYKAQGYTEAGYVEVASCGMNGMQPSSNQPDYLKVLLLRQPGKPTIGFGYYFTPGDSGGLLIHGPIETFVKANNGDPKPEFVLAEGYQASYWRNGKAVPYPPEGGRTFSFPTDGSKSFRVALMRGTCDSEIQKFNPGAVIAESANPMIPASGPSNSAKSGSSNSAKSAKDVGKCVLRCDASIRWTKQVQRYECTPKNSSIPKVLCPSQLYFDGEPVR